MWIAIERNGLVQGRVIVANRNPNHNRGQDRDRVTRREDRVRIRILRINEEEIVRRVEVGRDRKARNADQRVDRVQDRGVWIDARIWMMQREVEVGADRTLQSQRSGLLVIRKGMIRRMRMLIWSEAGIDRVIVVLLVREVDLLIRENKAFPSLERLRRIVEMEVIKRDWHGV